MHVADRCSLTSAACRLHQGVGDVVHCAICSIFPHVHTPARCICAGGRGAGQCDGHAQRHVQRTGRRVQVRGRGSQGGYVCAARPHSDMQGGGHSQRRASCVSAGRRVQVRGRAGVVRERMCMPHSGRELDIFAQRYMQRAGCSVQVWCKTGEGPFTYLARELGILWDRCLPRHGR